MRYLSAKTRITSRDPEVDLDRCWDLLRQRRPRKDETLTALYPGLGVVLAAELRRLRLTFVPGFFKDRRDLRVGDEVLKARLIPVEEHPDPVARIWIAKDGRTLGPVLLSLLSALG